MTPDALGVWIRQEVVTWPGGEPVHGMSKAEWINNGDCEPFAEYMVDSLRKRGLLAIVLASDDLARVTCKQCGVWRSPCNDDDEERGVSFDVGDGNAACAELHLDYIGGWHWWTFYAGRHYDSEAPEGVESWLDLPFFARMREVWIVERGDAPDVERARIEHSITVEHEMAALR